MTTPKQDRNGVPGPGATGGNVAQPGADVTGEIRSVMRVAEAAANARKVETHDELLATPQGSGVAGHTVGAAGNMYEWDSGLAVNEPAGEA